MNDPLPNSFILLNMTFFVFFSFLSLLLHSFFHCFVCSAKDKTTIFFKKQEEQDLKINHTRVSFIWIQGAQNKLSMTTNSCTAC